VYQYKKVGIVAVVTQLYFWVLSLESTTCFGPFGPSSGRTLYHKESLYSVTSVINRLGALGRSRYNSMGYVDAVITRSHPPPPPPPPNAPSLLITLVAEYKLSL